MIQFSAGLVDLRLVLTLIKSNPTSYLILIPSLVDIPKNLFTSYVLENVLDKFLKFQ